MTGHAALSVAACISVPFICLLIVDIMSDICGFCLQNDISADEMFRAIRLFEILILTK